MKLRVHVMISGVVQGVFFRASTRDKAEQLGIFGWVRNTSEGNVEAVFEGEKKALDDMISWCHNGPRMAKVENVDFKKEVYQGEFDSFKIRY